jgi:flagellar basal-body rod protein FlgF
VNQSGHPVMGTGGPLTLSTSNPVIDKLGRIFEKDVQVGQVKMVTFSDLGQLSYLGDGLYDGAKAVAIENQDSNHLRQGHVEASNVSSMHEMVRMIETLRHFESMQKVVQALDSSHDTVISKLGQF